MPSWGVGGVLLFAGVPHNFSYEICALSNMEAIAKNLNFAINNKNWLFSDLAMGLQDELLEPMSWAMEKSEKQKSGNKAVILGQEKKKLLFILCTRSYASPKYLFASQVGLAVCRQETGELLSSMVDSKPPKEKVSQEATLVRILWEKRSWESQSVREKSEYYGSWSEWDIRYSGGGNGGDTLRNCRYEAQNFDWYKTPKGTRWKESQRMWAQLKKKKQT